MRRVSHAFLEAADRLLFARFLGARLGARLGADRFWGASFLRLGAARFLGAGFLDRFTFDGAILRVLLLLRFGGRRFGGIAGWRRLYNTERAGKQVGARHPAFTRVPCYSPTQCVRSGLRPFEI